jgi:prophage DNA circulation protein
MATVPTSKRPRTGIPDSLTFPDPTALQRLPRASWNGIEFPVKKVQLKGSLRHHVHEYPHAPGGAFENLGRKLYEVSMTASFMENFAQYPALYPDRLDRMRDSFETGAVGDLVVPQVGTIKARCINWSQTLEDKIQSGEMVELSFLEDQSQLFLIDALVRQGISSFGSTVDRYDIEVAASGVNLTIFDSIRDAANSVLAFADQAQAFGNLLEAKILGLQALIDEADADVDFLQHPENWNLWTAMRDLWAANEKLLDDLFSKNEPVATFIVPMTMTIADVSSAIYGDSTHSVELLQLNPVDDAFAVPAGFRMRYYPGPRVPATNG